MRTGFTGVGTATGTFGRHLITGPTIVASNSRAPETRADFVADAVKGIEGRGRILIDATNAHVDPVPDISPAGVTRSRAASKRRTSRELIAQMAVAARLGKPISNMLMASVRGTIS